VELEIIDRTVDFRVSRERVLCFCYADRITGDSHLCGQLDFLTGYRAVSDDTGSINVGSHFLYFLFDAVIILIGERQRSGRLFLDGFYHKVGQIYSPLSSFVEGVVDGKSYSQFFAMLP
jgi:hypothetical protein